MARLSEIFQKLNRECPRGEDGQPVGVTYEAIAESLRLHRIDEVWILQQLRDIVVAELAAGVAAYQGMCGPEIHASSLRTAEGRQLVGLLGGIIDVQAKIVKERNDKCQTSAKSMPGSESPGSESPPQE